MALGMSQHGSVEEPSLLRQLVGLVARLLAHGLQGNRMGQGWRVASYLPGGNAKPSVWAMLQVRSTAATLHW